MNVSVKHSDIRKGCLKYMYCNGDRFIPFVSQDGEDRASTFDLYLDRMSSVSNDRY